MKKPFFPMPLFLLALGLSSIITPCTLASDEFLAQAIKAYREGNYSQAEGLLTQIHQNHPEDIKATYYLAITEAQLGRFQQAKKLYEAVISLDPNSDTAKLAQQGLNYLPSEAAPLDLPPKFQVGTEPAPTNPSAVTAAPGSLPNGMSMQDMMTMQMMMSQMGGNNNGNAGMMNPMANPWAAMMMPGMQDPNNPNGSSNMDPNLFSNMLMNQMMQNFDLSGSKDKDQ